MSDTFGGSFAKALVGMAYSRQNAVGGYTDGSYAGFPLMNRDSPVNRHATVVGPVSNPQGEVLYVHRQGSNQAHYDAAYARVLGRAKKIHGGQRLVENLVRAVYDEVDQTTKYSIAGVDRIWKRSAVQKGVPQHGTPIENWDFIKQGQGVCRHMALACAALLEMAQEANVIQGQANYHRSQAVVNNDRAGHAWARFTDKAGRRWILDVAQRYCGLLENGPAQGWNYFRDDELHPSKQSSFLTLGRQMDGTWRVAESIVTSDRVFTEADLDPRKGGRYKSLIAQTSSGNRYVIGWDADTSKAFVINEQSLKQGRNAKRYLTQTPQVRVGDSMAFSYKGGESWSTSVKRIVAIERAGIKGPTTRNARADDALEQFLLSVNHAMVATPLRLGPATDDRVVRGSARRERIVYKYDVVGTSVNLGDVLKSSSYRRAWLQTRSGNVYQFERAANGTGFVILNVDKTQSCGRVDTAAITSLGLAKVGSSFIYNNGSNTTSVQAIFLEREELLTTDEARKMTDDTFAAAARRAERIFESIAPQPNVGGVRSGANRLPTLDILLN